MVCHEHGHILVTLKRFSRLPILVYIHVTIVVKVEITKSEGMVKLDRMRDTGENRKVVGIVLILEVFNIF